MDEGAFVILVLSKGKLKYLMCYLSNLVLKIYNIKLEIGNEV